MQIDPAVCYEAFCAKDRRLDGRIFAGVVTTGIYCRTVCPVPPARKEHIQWFLCAAAAEAAGFRPCRRCRPDVAPGTPAWLGTSALVSRALRLIAHGGLDDEDIEAFAGRLGVGARHLRRLFVRHLGASPARIARVRRVHFARALIDQQTLSMREIAFASGFKSVRQFNHAFRETFRSAPNKLKRLEAEAAAGVRSDSPLTLHLSYRPPLDWEFLLSFWRERAIAGVEEVTAQTYRRTIEIGGNCGIIELSPLEEGVLLLRVHLSSYGTLLQVTDRVRQMCDLDADPLQIAAHLSLIPRLREAAERWPGLRVPVCWTPFELGVLAILGQKLTRPGALALAAGTARGFGRRIEGYGTGLTHLFPSATALLGADLGRVGLSAETASAIRALAAAMAAGGISPDHGRDRDRLSDALPRVPGLPVSARAYFAMRALGEPDAFPGVEIQGFVRKDPTWVNEDELVHIENAARPWRAYAAMSMYRMFRERSASLGETGAVRSNGSRTRRRARIDAAPGEVPP